VAGAALSIVAVLALGFAADLLLLGSLRHARDQEVKYARLRGDLANATAPVGPVDQAGKPYRLGTPVAIIEIPQIGVREVVGEGTTPGVLVSGPGHLRSAPLPGQAGISVIMGRRATFGGPFRHLDELRVGDTFTVTTGQGLHTYRVRGLRRAGDPLPPTLAEGQGRLMLATSAGPSLWPDRVLQVDADLASAVQPTPAGSAGPVPDSEKLLGSDRSAWVPLTLWAQGLLIATAAITWARVRWGRWQAWVVGVPLLGMLGFAVANQAAALLPNLL